MCQKRSTVKARLGSRSVRVDPCLRPLIEDLNAAGFETVACCCGHERRASTIVVRKDRKNFEIIAGKEIPRKRKLYRMDENGFFFIPESHTRRESTMKDEKERCKKILKELREEEVPVDEITETPGWTKNKIIEATGIPHSMFAGLIGILVDDGKVKRVGRTPGKPFDTYEAIDEIPVSAFRITFAKLSSGITTIKQVPGYQPPGEDRGVVDFDKFIQELLEEHGEKEDRFNLMFRDSLGTRFEMSNPKIRLSEFLGDEYIARVREMTKPPGKKVACPFPGFCVALERDMKYCRDGGCQRQRQHDGGEKNEENGDD